MLMRYCVLKAPRLCNLLENLLAFDELLGHFIGF